MPAASTSRRRRERWLVADARGRAHVALAGRRGLGRGAAAAPAGRDRAAISPAPTRSSPTPAEKRALGIATGAIAVDTESHVVAAFAAAHGIPFAVFRVIADPAGAGARAGRVHAACGPTEPSTGARCWAPLLRKPGQLPALMRNALDARTAVRALSRGRRLLGPGLGYPDFGQLLLDVP